MKLSRFYIISSLVFAGALQATGQTDIKITDINSVRTAVPFLTIAPDSRSAGMGDIGVATSPDVNSMHWNPAKYAFIDYDGGVALSYSPWLRTLVNDMNLLYLTGYKRIDNFQVIAASLRYFDMGNIAFYDEAGTFLVDGRPNEFSIDVGYSRKFSDKIGAALAFRYIRSDIASGISQTAGMKAKAGNSFAADVGVYYHSDLQLGDKKGTWALGADISNIGAKMSYSNDQEKMFIPVNLRFGGAFGLNVDEFNEFTFAVDFNKLLVPTPPVRSQAGDIVAGKNDNVGLVQGMFQSFGDAPGGFSEELREITCGLGLEYLYREVFAVRTGYFYETPKKGNRKYFAMGVGLKMNVFSIDFSYLIPAYSGNPLANTLRFTLIFNLGQVKVS
jgi:hypothetical protein